MKKDDFIQKFIKVIRIAVIVLMSLCLAMTLFCLIGLALCVVYGNSYIWSLHYIVAFIISLFNNGSYYGSLALAATAVIACAVRTALLYYGLRCCSSAVRENTPFNRETCREVFWLGIKVIIFPVAAMFLNVAIFSYMGLVYTGFYVGGIASVIVGALLIGLSVVLHLGTKKSAQQEAEADNTEYESEEIDIQKNEE